MGKREDEESGIPAPDPRLRLGRGKYRVVAPAGRVNGTFGSFYVNGQLVIEKRVADALGDPVWAPVVTLDWPDSADQSVEAEGVRAVFALLAGSAADKELSG